MNNNDVENGLENNQNNLVPNAKDKVNSVLILDRLLFDKINFERIGLKNDSEFEFDIGINTGRHKTEPKRYRVALSVIGRKMNEYNIEIVLIGLFSIGEKEETLPDEVIDRLIRHNAVAILMPYIRSQISTLTAQPNVDCVVLQPFNINKIMMSAENKK